MENLLSFHREHTKTPTAQGSLFGSAQVAASLKLEPAAEAPQKQRLDWEKELLGLFISGHPLDTYRAQLSKQPPLAVLAKNFPRGASTVIGGYLETTNTILTKKGDRMLFGQLSDGTSAIEIVVFPKVLADNAALFAPGSCILLRGSFSTRNGEPSFAVDKVKALG
jgi:DNA polymerase-3 subunit alpha